MQKIPPIDMAWMERTLEDMAEERANLRAQLTAVTAQRDALLTGCQHALNLLHNELVDTVITNEAVIDLIMAIMGQMSDATESPASTP